MTSAVKDAGLPVTIPAGAPVDPDRKGPGRPRSARVDEAIISSVIDLMAEGTPAESLSIEAVAARAGVGKATIYRRWANKDALLIDAVASMKGPLPEIEGKSVRDDLITLLRPVGVRPQTHAASVLPCLVTELKRSPILHNAYQRVVEPRRQLMRDVIERGIATGELRSDIDIEVVLAILVGPMMAQNIMNWNPKLDTAGLPERIIRTIWPAIVGRPPVDLDE